MSSPDFTPLAEALRERLAVIADHAHRDRDAAAHLERLIEVSGRIDALSAALPAEELDPQFLHYLERRSYDKALAWIEESAG
jgi:predicted 2-oxoglutarate/Fe(II)-dependent dioxygenase YbiX